MMARITFFKAITDVDGPWAVSAVFANYFQGCVDSDIYLLLYYDLNNTNNFNGTYYFNNHVNVLGVGI